MRADEKKSFTLNIPSDIVKEYIVKYNLVPLDYIDLGDGTGIVPFVTAKEKSFMEAEGCVSENFNVEMELIFCVNDGHKGNRVMVINVFVENTGMMPVWVNFELNKGGGCDG